MLGVSRVWDVLKWDLVVQGFCDHSAGQGKGVMASAYIATHRDTSRRLFIGMLQWLHIYRVCGITHPSQNRVFIPNLELFATIVIPLSNTIVY